MTSQSIGRRDQKDIDSSQTIEVKLEEGEKEKTWNSRKKFTIWQCKEKEGEEIPEDQKRKWLMTSTHSFRKAATSMEKKPRLIQSSAALSQKL